MCTYVISESGQWIVVTKINEVNFMDGDSHDFEGSTDMQIALGQAIGISVKLDVAFNKFHTYLHIVIHVLVCK